ncbi:hypothetical protein EZV62_006219 [Acer yangbiense]|uniref:F-box associated domain-containing protein n=1 Tax=Acer yangbiense TaxID=1000413 RepID=A0A5C7IR40_9ROSI|nr:hypothetical protein EZV62_006219 [Acer yangbiense]
MKMEFGYGVTGSWTKLLITKSVQIRELHPLCYLNNNETILVRVLQPSNNSVKNRMFWDAEDEEFKDLNIDCCIQGDWRFKNVYVESLISPNHINDFTIEVSSSFVSA